MQAYIVWIGGWLFFIFLPSIHLTIHFNWCFLHRFLHSFNRFHFTITSFIIQHRFSFIHYSILLNLPLTRFLCLTAPTLSYLSFQALYQDQHLSFIQTKEPKHLPFACLFYLPPHCWNPNRSFIILLPIPPSIFYPNLFFITCSLFRYQSTTNLLTFGF